MDTSKTAISQLGRVVFFGLGAQFRECYRQIVLALGREPDFLCDNDGGKWGKEFLGRPCLSPDRLQEISQSGEKVAVVITVRRYEEIYRQLSAMGVENVFLACFDRAYDVVHDIKRLTAGMQRASCGIGVRSVAGCWTLVTGATRGIGRRIAVAMADLGANLIVHGRSLEHTHEVAGLCVDKGVEVRRVAADLGDPGQVEVMLEELASRYPPIDIVFNNAGICLSENADPWNVSSEDYRLHFQVNTIAPIRICYRFIPTMVQRGWGRVVNISSTIQGRPAEMAYACSKAALNKFVGDLAPSLEGTGVMICLACPGHVRSDMGGPDAPHGVDSVIPGVLLGALMDADVNGRWFVAQDYAGLDLEAAVRRAAFYYDYGSDKCAG